MGKVKKIKKPGKNARGKRKKWLIPVICLVCMGLAVAVVYGLMNRSATEPTATVPQKKETPDFDRLVGNWVRPDGGYVIEIRKIYPDGKVDAAYFNPQSIHVSRSTVSEKDGIIELFIELQGQGNGNGIEISLSWTECPVNREGTADIATVMVRGFGT